MSSLVEMEMQYQQHLPQQQPEKLSLPIQQHAQLQQEPSYLAAVSGNNYAALRQALKQRLKRQQHRRHMQPYRQFVGAATNNHGGYASGGSAQAGPYAGYSSSGPGGDYHDYQSNQNMPTNGGYSSFHSSPGSGYADGPVHSPHPPHPPHPPPIYHTPIYTAAKVNKGKSKKQKDGSTMSALTLLAFFFFVNLLQSCLKEHMNTMNPTVMVMTVNGVRNRFNKLAEMNSREQSAAVASDSTSSHITVVEPGDLHASSTHTHSISTEAQSPYSSDLVHANKLVSVEHNNNNDHYHKLNNIKNKAHANKYDNNNYKTHHGEHANSFSNQSTRPEFYDSIHSFGRTNHSNSVNVFSTYLRSFSPNSSNTMANKSHNYSFHDTMDDVPTFQTLKQRDRYMSPSHLDNSYESSLVITAAPTSYWSIAGMSSSAVDFHQHHADDDDDIDRRYSLDSYAHHN